MNNKSMNKLTTMLSEVLSSTLEKHQVDNVMKVWNEKKSDVSKLIDSSTRVKRKKDPNAPKKWKTGYILFCVDQRDKLKKENEGLSATEVTSRLGALWKNLSDKDKSKYEEMSKKDKNRYENEMQSYSPQVETTASRKRAQNGSKGAMSSYMYYCQDNREMVKSKNSQMSGKQVNVELSRLWKELPSEQKLVFEQRAKSEKERVQSEKGLKTVEEVKQPPPPLSAKKAQTSSKQKTVPEEKPKKTVEPPSKNKEVKKEQNSAGFKYFCEEQMEDLQSEHPSWNQKKMESELKKMWQSLNKEDRESYDLEASEDAVQDSEEELDD
jgi:hypothetical protein